MDDFEDKEEESTELQRLDAQKAVADAHLKELEQMSKMANHVMKNISNDRDKAEELYEFMKEQIDQLDDKNPATREAMSKSVELQMKGTDQIIELLKVKGKMINPNKGTAININLGNYDEKRGGDTNELIDIANKYRNK